MLVYIWLSDLALKLKSLLISGLGVVLVPDLGPAYNRETYNDVEPHDIETHRWWEKAVYLWEGWDLRLKDEDHREGQNHQTNEEIHSHGVRVWSNKNSQICSKATGTKDHGARNPEARIMAIWVNSALQGRVVEDR